MFRTRKAIGLLLFATSTLASADILEISDDELAKTVGQSGLMIEAGFGGAANKADITNVDWSSAGITVDAFKWEFDMENYDSLTNIHAVSGSGFGGGFIAERISIAGAVDITIDGSSDIGSSRGAIGFDFTNSNIDMRVGNMAACSGASGVGESMGAIEILTLNIDGMDLFISGNGAPNP